MLVQLANANASATKNANLKIMRVVLTTPPARYKQNRIRTTVGRRKVGRKTVQSDAKETLRDSPFYPCNRSLRETVKNCAKKLCFN